MWKLCKYDIMKSRKYILTAIFLDLFIIIIVICSNTITSETLLVTTSFIFFIQVFTFFMWFPNMYSKRCTKDDIVYYAGITKRTVLLEPIVMLSLFCILNAIMICIPLLYDMRVNLFLSIGKATLMETNNSIFNTYLLNISMINSIIFLYGGISLCFWSMLKKKNRVNVAIGETNGFTMIIILIFSKVSSGIFSYLEYELILYGIVGLLCMIVYYVKNNNQDAIRSL